MYIFFQVIFCSKSVPCLGSLCGIVNGCVRLMKGGVWCREELGVRAVKPSFCKAVAICLTASISQR